MSGSTRMVHLREILDRYPRTARTRRIASGHTWMVVLVQVDRDEPPPDAGPVRIVGGLPAALPQQLLDDLGIPRPDSTPPPPEQDEGDYIGYGW